SSSSPAPRSPPANRLWSRRRRCKRVVSPPARERGSHRRPLRDGAQPGERARSPRFAETSAAEARKILEIGEHGDIGQREERPGEPLVCGKNRLDSQQG